MARTKTDAPGRREVAGRKPKLVPLRDVIEMTSMSRSQIYALKAAGAFPQPVRVSARAVRWIEGEVVEFVATRPRAGSERRPRR